MNNVISLKKSKQIDREVECEIERERHKAVDAFNAAFARWLRARAKVLGPPPKKVRTHGKTYDAYMSKIDREYQSVTERLARTPALFKYQIDHKFEVLYELLDNDPHAGSLRELARSIQSDIKNLDTE